MDHKKWNSRIVVTIACCIGAVVASVLINVLTVSEQYEMDGIRKQDVKINYKFIGCLKEYDLCG